MGRARSRRGVVACENNVAGLERAGGSHEVPVSEVRGIGLRPYMTGKYSRNGGPDPLPSQAVVA